MQIAPNHVRGTVLAALPRGQGDWPRFIPGGEAREQFRGSAGDRIIADPGVPLSCLPGAIQRALNDVALRFGPILIRSTYRPIGRARSGGRNGGSYHLDCRAADFRIEADARPVLAYLRSRVDLGGVKQYRNGLIHIDDGPRRGW